jgi:hypothetical protein
VRSAAAVTMIDMDQNPEQGSEQEPAASGNRWEPAGPDAQPRAGEPVAGSTYPQPSPPPNPQPNPYIAEYPAESYETTAPASPSRPTWLTRARAAVAGGAVAALIVGGLGGLAIGRATADADGASRDHQGVRTGFDDDGFGPGGPQLGQLPNGGQVPGMPGQDDGQQDDDWTNGSDT